MICNNLTTWKKDLPFLPKQINKALEWAEINIKNPPIDGKYFLENGSFVIVQTYDPNPWEGKEFENHHKYIDVQVIAKGAEYIGWTQIPSKNISQIYEDSKDIEFFLPDSQIEYTYLFMSEGMFAILWPGDWHMPCLSPNRKFDSKQHIEKVVKFVVKVPLDSL